MIADGAGWDGLAPDELTPWAQALTRIEQFLRRYVVFARPETIVAVVLGSEAERRARHLAALRRRRSRLVALAAWLPEQGLAGESVAHAHVADAIAADVAVLAA